MKKLLSLLTMLLIGVVVFAQTLDTTIRNKIFQFTSNGLKYGVFIPTEWNSGDTNHVICVSWYGNGERGSDSTTMAKTPPFRLFTTAAKNYATMGRWTSKVKMNNGDTKVIAHLMIPNYDDVGGTAGKYAAAVAQFIRLMKIDTSNHRRFIFTAISGGTYRSINAMTNPNDTAYKYMRLFDKGIWMSPASTSQSAATLAAHFKGSRYLVWCSKNDSTTRYTTAVTLYNKLPNNGFKGLDSMLTGGHSVTCWDSAMTNLNVYTQNGGTAKTNRWRMLLGDPFVANNPPTANAGTDKTIGFSDPLTLSGTGTDSDGTIASYQWVKISGPGCTITNPNSATTSVTGLTAGIYVFQLRVTDNAGFTTTDDMVVEVATGNTAPVVYIGPNVIITYPDNTVSITATATDPDGVISVRAWSKVTGPDGGTILSPASETTSLSDLRVGTYVYRFTVTDDDGAVTFDELEVEVNPRAINHVIIKGKKLKVVVKQN
jgi:hypothetical protein